MDIDACCPFSSKSVVHGSIEGKSGFHLLPTDMICGSALEHEEFNLLFGFLPKYVEDKQSDLDSLNLFTQQMISP